MDSDAEFRVLESNQLQIDASQPENILPSLIQVINLAIDKAPVIDPSEPHKQIYTYENTLTVDFPGQSHLIPLLERAIYESLLMAEQRHQGRRLNPRSLMAFDSRLSTLKTTVDDGVEIRGETYLEHEQEHARAAQAEGASLNKIIVPFIWKKRSDGILELEIPEVSHVHNAHFEVGPFVRTLLAPRFPSSADYALCDMALETPNIDRQSLEAEINKFKARAPKYKGNIIQTGEMKDIFYEHWRQLPQLPRLHIVEQK